ncbi:MAG TPA: ATP-binding protein [Elusimicrobiota bacterium]|nr:ATP-binding protein [Elusimicrobiota bacterium]
MPTPIRVLIAIDVSDDAQWLLDELRCGGYSPVWKCVVSLEELGDALLSKPWDVVVADYSTSSFTGLDVFNLVRKRGLDIPVIIISDPVGDMDAAELLRLGIADFLIKGHLERLVPVIERELRREGVKKELNDLRREMRAKSEQLYQANKVRFLGHLAGGMAHDFNNLLTAIIGYTDVVLQDLKTGKVNREDVEGIRLAAQKSAVLSRQLLVFNPRHSTEPRPVDVNQFVTDMEKMFQRLIGDGIRLELGLDAHLHPAVVDPVHLGQILFSLAVSAMESMPEGGRLIIETANARLEAMTLPSGEEVRPGDYVLLAVSDTGPGMDAHTQSRLFNPALSSPPEDHPPGLDTAYRIVRQNAGYITIYSELGRGKTVKVHLPRSPEQSEKD